MFTVALSSIPRLGLCVAAVAAVIGVASPAASAATCGAVAGNLVQDCGFESPVVPEGAFTPFAPGAAMDAWTVAPGGDAVDLVSHSFQGPYPVHEGAQSLDLNHDTSGGVYQDLATSPGTLYTLTFFYSGLPSGCSTINPKSFTVTAGSTSEGFTFAPDLAASPPGNQRFDAASLMFAGASGAATRLTFTSTSGGCTGPIIDDVTVTAGSTPACTITGTSGDNTLTGTSGADVICGLGGDDTLKGLGGNDVLIGGDGNDTLQGGSGVDDLQGGAGTDTADYRGRIVGVSVSLDGSADDGEPGEGDNARSDVENVLGGAGDDTLTGNDQANTLIGYAGNDTLQGVGGNDTLQGGLGADDLSGGTGTDTVDYRSRTNAVSVSLNSVADDGESGEGDNAQSDVENVLGGAGNDTLTGNDQANTLIGYAGDDTLTGGLGKDTLSGGDGGDALNSIDGLAGDRDTCGAGADTVLADPGDSVAADC